MVPWMNVSERRGRGRSGTEHLGCSLSFEFLEPVDTSGAFSNVREVEFVNGSKQSGGYDMLDGNGSLRRNARDGYLMRTTAQ